MNNQIMDAELLSLVKTLNKDSTAYDEIQLIEYAPPQGLIELLNQEYILHNVSEPSVLPEIEASASVKLKKNGAPVAGRTKLGPQDTLEWEIVSKPLFTIEVSEDCMHAYLLIHSKHRYAWKLKNAQPSNYVKFEAEEDKSEILDSLEFAEIINSLQEKSVVRNIDHFAICQEFLSPTYQRIEVAKGVEPVPGLDAVIELYVKEKVENYFDEVEGVIDLRSHLKIPTVKKGEMIARKIPMIEGVPGYDVYGSRLNPPSPRDIQILPKNFVEINEHGEIKALKDGRPRVIGDQNKFVEITEVYVVTGDVNLKTGHIVFAGDVVVYGNAEEGAVIEALGSVYIYGNAYGASISAAGSIHVKGNTIDGKLFSGHYGVRNNRLYQAVAVLSDSLAKLLQAANSLNMELEVRKQKANFGQLISLLIERKFSSIPSLIKDLTVIISSVKHVHGEAAEELMGMLKTFYLTVSYNSLPAEFWSLLLNMLQRIINMIEQNQEMDAKVTIDQCHITRIQAAGSIIIHGDGVLQSHLYSNKNIVFSKENAICRSSRIEAEGSISAAEVGGEAAGETFLKAGKSIRVKKIVHCKVCIKNYCRQILERTGATVFDLGNMKYRQ
ncbi:FapA family protein [Paenibacillus eucommiae]|uniref:Uncharacterized protein (DUF342 family) n=1 Tax=Paenibacillus eucommiae TaxID=1355755 RepID=A0ABS4J171_9BACL|nr:FapA family protein [Paenibacillus eucommiae]MBP1993540.1 uncharacterized protein (DUF342 family) [Paenibacillus eucommiae]